ncbi:MAG TPA: ATPase, partial [Archaeoglobus veneficus]|nr:ATPase [Archaeoglobus veneficus]
MKGAVGRICGEASPTDFSFVVFDPKEVRRTDYVKVWNDVDGWVVAQVVDIRATSEASNSDILQGRDVEKELYIAKAIVIGKRDEKGMLKVPKTPFVPGENVFKAEEELVIDVLGLEKDGVYLGLLEDSN